MGYRLVKSTGFSRSVSILKIIFQCWQDMKKLIFNNIEFWKDSHRKKNVWPNKALDRHIGFRTLEKFDKKNGPSECQIGKNLVGVFLDVDRPSALCNEILCVQLIEKITIQRRRAPWCIKSFRILNSMILKQKFNFILYKLR